MNRLRRSLSTALIATLLTACSVSTPRNGFTQVGAGSRPGATGPVADGAPADPLAPGEVTADGTPPVPGGGDTTGAGPSAGGGAAGPSTAGGQPAGPAGGARPSAGASGPRTASDVGITADTITVSAIYAQSGPYGSVAGPVVAEGLDTWVTDVNARGGINGRKVAIRRVDHQETSAGGVAACRQAISNGTFVSLVLEGVGEANFTAPDCLDDAGIPNLSFAPLYDPSWKRVFTPIGLSDAAGRTLPSHIRKVVASPAAKVGVLHLTSAGLVAAKDAFVTAAKAEAVKIVGIETVEPNQGSVVPQLLRLRDAGADVVVVLVALEAITVFRDLRTIGWSPKVTGYGWVFDLTTTAGRDTMRGAHGLRFSAVQSAPAAQEFTKKRRAQGRADGFDGEAGIVYGIMLLFEEGMRRAGSNPTRASWTAAMESIKGYDNGLIPPITFAPGRHIGTEAFFPVVCCEPNFTWSAKGPASSRF